MAAARPCKPSAFAPRRPPRVPRSPCCRVASFAQWAVLAGALVVAVCQPRLAQADGYNDWSAEITEPGRIWIVPAWQQRVSPVAESYVQMQLQIGLAPKVDIILSGALWLTSARQMPDVTWIQPRIEIIPGLALSPGVAVQGSGDGDPSGWLPGLFATIDRGPWRCNINIIGGLPFGNLGAGEVFAPIVLQRRLTPEVAVFVELDVTSEFAQPSDSALDGFVGVQVELGDLDTLNLSLATPLRPEFAPASLAVGLWWSHGVQVNPVRWGR